MKKVKRLYRYCVARWLSPPETFIKYYLNNKHGAVKLQDGTWAVNQSDEFHAYCYGEAYKNWKKN